MIMMKRGFPVLYYKAAIRDNQLVGAVAQIILKKRAKSFFTNIELLCFFLFELLGFYFASFTPHLSNFLEENSNMVSFICFTKLLFPLHLSSLCIWAYILLKPELHIFYHFISKCFSHEGTNFIRKLSLTNAQEWILFSYLNYLHGKAKDKFFLSRLNKSSLYQSTEKLNTTKNELLAKLFLFIQVFLRVCAPLVSLLVQKFGRASIFVWSSIMHQ